MSSPLDLFKDDELIIAQSNAPVIQSVFKVADNGEFMDGVFKEIHASEIYGKVIGRNAVARNDKSIFTADDIVREGYLWKQGSWKKNWKRRYFILRRDIHELCYYESKDDLKLLGTIPLVNGVYIWRVDQREIGIPNVIAVQPRLPAEGDALPSKRSANAILIRGDVDDESPITSWITDIGLQSQAKASADVEEEEDLGLDMLVDANINLEGFDNDLWWPLLFSRAPALSSLSPKPSGSQSQVDPTPKPPISRGSSSPAPLPTESLTDSNQIDSDLSFSHGFEGLDILKSPSPPPKLGDGLDSAGSSIPVSHQASEDVFDRGNDHIISNLTSADQLDSGTPLPARLQKHSAGGLDFGGPGVSSPDDVGQSGKPGLKAMSSANIYDFDSDDDSDVDDDAGFVPDGATAFLAEGTGHKKKQGIMRALGLKKKEKKSGEVHKKGKKAKSEELAPPPSINKLSESYREPNALFGIQLCVYLQHMVSCQDKIYLVTFAGNRVQSQNEDKWGVSWVETSHTEVALVSDQAEYGGSYVENYIHKFTLLQNPWDSVSVSEYPLAMVVLYKALSGERVTDNVANTMNMKKKVNKTGVPDIPYHIALCRCVLNRKHVLREPIFTVVMDLLIDIPIDISAVLLASPNATLGVCSLKSPALQKRYQMLRQLLPDARAYCEVPYAFPYALGSVLAIEHLCASKYSATTAAAFLSFLYQERAPLLDLEINNFRHTLNLASEITSESYDAQRHMNLKKLFQDLEELQDKLIDDFVVPYMYICKHLLNKNQKIQQAFLDVPQGGNYLRRSAWKKNPPLQYCATNLNMQLLYFERFGVADILKRNRLNSKVAVSTDSKANFTLSSITMGCPAAHGLKFAEGGLMKILATNDGSKHQNVRESVEIAVSSPSKRLSTGVSSGFSARTTMAFPPFPTSVTAGYLEWMHFIQCWKCTEDLCGYIRAKKKEGGIASLLCGSYADPLASREARVHLWSKRASIAKRIDICTSQALGAAVAAARTLSLMATQVGEHYFDMLVRSLKCGFLVGFQSYLSTQGDELGMLEDLFCAASWLDMVTLRFISPLPIEASSKDKFEFSDGFNSNSRIAITHLIHNSARSKDGKKLAIGRSEGVTIRRGVKENIIVDIEISPPECAVVARAMEVAKKIGTYMEAAGELFPAFEPFGNCHYGENEIRPTIIAVSGFVGATFTQGINEMQTLANMSGSDAIMRQIEINKESMVHLTSYYDRYRLMLSYQIKILDSVKMRSDPGPTCDLREDTIVRPTDIKRKGKTSRLSNFLGLSKDDDDYDILIYPRVDDSGCAVDSYSAAGKVKLNYAEYLDSLLDSLTKCINRTLQTPNEKNVNVLINSSNFIRSVSGVVCILCKSGKDRTSMGVTLDQGRALTENGPINAIAESIQTMRKYGVRRMNVYANTGQSMYAFNSIQRRALPNCFRPPQGTFTGKVNS